MADSKGKTTLKRDSEQTKARIIDAATREFARKGYDGARVDAIAEEALVNKTTIYHYFENKEALFILVLEHAYAQIRSRQNDIEIRGMDPEAGLRKLVESTARIWAEVPEFNQLLSSENLHEARHVRKSPRIREMYNPLLETLRDLMRRGVASGQFRDDVDIVDLYISLTALSAHYISRRHTFEVIFDQDLMEPARFRQRIEHSAEMICRHVRAGPRLHVAGFAGKTGPGAP
jgi:TetR/AcrR family transcriptional regulator